jgi:hypothetical protein
MGHAYSALQGLQNDPPMNLFWVNPFPLIYGITAYIRSYTAYIQYMEIPCTVWANPMYAVSVRVSVPPSSMLCKTSGHNAISAVCMVSIHPHPRLGQWRPGVPVCADAVCLLFTGSRPSLKSCKLSRRRSLWRWCVLCCLKGLLSHYVLVWCCCKAAVRLLLLRTRFAACLRWFGPPAQRTIKNKLLCYAPCCMLSQDNSAEVMSTGVADCRSLIHFLVPFGHRWPGPFWWPLGRQP